MRGLAGWILGVAAIFAGMGDGWTQVTEVRPAGVTRLLIPLERAESRADRHGGVRAEVLRSRWVRADFGTHLGEIVELELFADAKYAAVRDVLQSANAPVGSWSGEVAGHDDSRVNLIRRDGILVGSVRIGNTLFQIGPDPQGPVGAHLVQQIDGSKLPGCASGDDHIVAGNSSSALPPIDQVPPDVFGSSSEEMTAADGEMPMLEIMVLYTPEARAVQGEAAIRATIDLALLETNQAYEMSGVNMRLRTAYVGEIGYTETGNFEAELSRLRTEGDGFLDEAHDLRDEYGADVVSLIVASGTYCGIGYVMTNPSSNFEDWAFNVVARGCATGYYSFGHELGHNLGCQHDHQHSGNGAYEFSYGHRSNSGSWRTIMAYSPGARIQRFSNPDVMYQSEPTGVPVGQAGQADNAHSIDQVAAIVTQFREPALLAYGVGKLTSIGSMPELGWSGSPTTGNANFALTLSGAVPGSIGVVLMGLEPAETPFAGGTLWVQGSPGGVRQFFTDDQGASNFRIPGQASRTGEVRYFQFLFRDMNHPDGTGVGATNGVKVTFGI